MQQLKSAKEAIKNIIGRKHAGKVDSFKQSRIKNPEWENSTPEDTTDDDTLYKCNSPTLSPPKLWRKERILHHKFSYILHNGTAWQALAVGRHNHGQLIQGCQHG